MKIGKLNYAQKDIDLAVEVAKSILKGGDDVEIRSCREGYKVLKVSRTTADIIVALERQAENISNLKK